MNNLPLPLDITNVILEFSGYHKFRTGKYLKQLDVNCSQIVELQERLLTRPWMRNGYVILRFSDQVSIVLFHHTNSYISYNNRL